MVRKGENVKLMDPHGESPRHTRQRVYSEMMIMIARVYHSLPDVRTMTLDEIAFFYDGIRGELLDRTKG